MLVWGGLGFARVWGRLGCNSRLQMHSASPPPNGSRGETPRTPPSAALGFPLRSACRGKTLGRRDCRVHLQSEIAAEPFRPPAFSWAEGLQSAFAIWNCSRALSAAIAESRLQLQNLGCNCRISAAIAIAGRSAAFVGGLALAWLQFQIANAPCSLPAQGKLDLNGLAAIADCKYTSWYLDAEGVSNCRWLKYN